MSMTHVGGPLRVGNFFGRNGSADQPGGQMAVESVYDVVPATLSTTAVAAAQAVAGAGNLTINGASASGGVATFDVPRAVQIVSSNAGDTTQTALFTGKDDYGVTMSELLAFNGTTPVLGQKAFKTITQVAISAALAGNASAGNTDIFGLPYAIASVNYIMAVKWAGALADDAATVAAADATSPATTTTNDVRGTVDPSSAADGSRRLTVYMLLANPNSRQGLYGVTQA